MRYRKGHKDATRAHIVEVASQRFRKDGIEAVGVAGLMADAGLTHGGFYSHFGSKEDLVCASVTEALAHTTEELRRVAEGESGGLEALVRTYLRPAHRDKPEIGCAAAALTSEIARRPAATRHAFTEGLEALVELIADQLPERTKRDARRRAAATAIFGLMMGTLQLARAVADKGQSDRILESGIDAALALAREFRG